MRASPSEALSIGALVRPDISTIAVGRGSVGKRPKPSLLKDEPEVVAEDEVVLGELQTAAIGIDVAEHQADRATALPRPRALTGHVAPPQARPLITLDPASE